MVDLGIGLTPAPARGGPGGENEGHRFGGGIGAAVVGFSLVTCPGSRLVLDFLTTVSEAKRG